ncbi:MAG: signal peptidase II [Rhizobiaceae bacterium]
MTRIKWIIVITILVAVDQFSKWLVETSLPLYSQIDLLPILSLYRTYNEGVAFSALTGLGPWLLVLLTTGIILFVLWLWRGVAADRLLSGAGFCLILAGAIGNLIDRVRIGKVIDMIYFHIDQVGFKFAIFNLADTFITLGAAAIILDEFHTWKSSRQKTSDEPEQDTGKTKNE